MAVLAGIEWVVAAITPEAISPHPNFGVREVTSVELFALLSEGRWADYERYRESQGQPARWLNSGIDPITAIEQSLLSETQERGIGQLLKFMDAGWKSESPGLLAAASLFASVALSELDRLEDAIRLLDTSLEALESRSRGPAGSVALLRSVVRQQRVLRLIEASRHEEAIVEARTVEQLAPRAGAAFDRFPLSKGTQRTAVQVQLEIAGMLRSHARSVRATFEGPGGKLWVDVVKAKPSPIDDRSIHREAEAGAAFIEETFEQSVSWTRQSRRFTSSDPIDGPVARALLHAELSGDLGATRRRRELLGRIRALRTAALPLIWSISESVRLLRQADAREPLEDVLRWIRADGPLMALSSSAHVILSRRSLQHSVTRCDLTVLSSAAELLEPDQLAKALKAAETFRTAPSGRLTRDGTVPWAVADAGWRFTASLIPDSGRDSHEARSALQAIKAADMTLPVKDAFEAVVSAIEWTHVTERTRAAWVKWARGHHDSDAFSLAVVALDGIEGVRKHDVGPPRPHGIELAVRLLWERAHDAEPSPAELLDATDSCIARLQGIRQAAASGSFGIGGISAPEVAVLLATQCGAEQVWRPLFDLLRDPLVAYHDKAPALDRLAVLQPELPSELLRDLDDDPFSTFAGNTLDPFEDIPLPVAPAVLRFAAAYSLLDYGAIVAATTRLAGASRLEGRVEAARCATYGTRSGQSAEWAAVLLLQLSHDNDAVVRSEAARALASRWTDYSSLGIVVQNRISELLAEDGLLVPLLTLRGITAASAIPSILRSEISGLATNHPARAIRNAANGALAPLDAEF